MSPKIYVAGHTGLLGSALVRNLTADGYSSMITRSHDELELTDKQAVESFFSDERPDYVFIAAGKVGGIQGNRTFPSDYLHTNLAIQDNIFEASIKFNVKNVVFLGSSCTYPKNSPQPMREEYVLTGPLEETSLGYATAKIAGINACKVYNRQYGANRFICLIPNSMYGPNDHFDLENSHVLSALVRRFHEAKASGVGEVVLWGSGTPRREFLFADDVADAAIFAVKNCERLENTHYNVGNGKDYSIAELADAIAGITGYSGKIKWDTSKPDGAPRKLLDSSKFNALGWTATTEFQAGLRLTYEWFKENYDRLAIS